MRFVTVWSKNVKRRSTGIVEKEWGIYETKSLTPAHARIHAHSKTLHAETWFAPRKVITHFCGDYLPLDKPIVVGGFQVNLSA